MGALVIGGAIAAYFSAAHAADLLVTSLSGDEVRRYDGATGTNLGVFAMPSVGPMSLAFGPDGHLYVANNTSDDVLRFQGQTGAPMGTFVSSGSGGLKEPGDLVFGVDGNLYIASSVSNEVLRYDGQTGAFLDAFVAAGSGGLSTPIGLAFGPDGKLYVSSADTAEVLRYDGLTGAFLDVFAGGPPLVNPSGLVFSEAGILFIADGGTHSVVRHQPALGFFLNVFVSPGSGGLTNPIGLRFDASGNLYVASFSTSEVLRYDPTGAFVDAFVPSPGGGLSFDPFLTFFPDLPSVPGFQVEEYASVPDPMRLSFVPDGTMFVGRDASGSGGGALDAVRIHRVASGGSPVTEYGDVATPDPDAVMVDWFKVGSPWIRAVMVGGMGPGGPVGSITTFAFDEHSYGVAGPTTNWGKPGDFDLFRNQYFFSNYSTTGTPGVFRDSALSSTGPVLQFGTSEVPYGIGVDSQGRIFVSADDGTLRVHEYITGALIDGALATGLGPAPLLAVGRFGGMTEDALSVDPTTGELLRIDLAHNTTVMGCCFGDATDLELGPDGALYVGEFDNDRVLRITPPEVCTDGIVGALEECDDGNTTAGDGCYSDCHLEEELVLQGLAQGGTVDLSLFGVVVTHTTTPGQSAEAVLVALAAKVGADPILSGLGISAVTLGNRLVTNGTIYGVDIADSGLAQCGAKVPALPGPWLALLVAALSAAAMGSLAWGRGRARGGSKGPMGRWLGCGALLGIAASGPLAFRVLTPLPASAQPSAGCTPHGSIVLANIGSTSALLFTPGGLVTELGMIVPLGTMRPWLAEHFALDITITSVDGVFHNHGTDVIPLSQTALFFPEDPLAEIIALWTVDTEPRVSGDLYRICAQLLADGAPIASETCISILF